MDEIAKSAFAYTDGVATEDILEGREARWRTREMRPWRRCRPLGGSSHADMRVNKHNLASGICRDAARVE
jgi:hypothetical protein